MNCDFTLCRHNNSAELNKEGLCTCKAPEKFCKYLQLKEQIEKMKCCGNCAKRGHICVAEEMQGNLCGKNKDKWELRR